jgi:DNA-directed RNA polymerase subunit D
MVLAADMKSDSDVRPLYPEMPITSLTENARLVIEAKAILGLGKDHAKWQAAIVGYKNYPLISVDKKKCNLCGRCIHVCPSGIFEKSGKTLNVKNQIKCSLCDHCTEVCEPGAIKVDRDPKRFTLSVESISCLTPEQILLKGAAILQHKGRELEKLLK